MPDKPSPHPPAAADEAERLHLGGRLALSDGRVGAGVAVRLYGRGFGGGATMLGEGETDAEGLYSIAYAAGRGAGSTELRAVDPAGKETLLTEPMFELEPEATVNLVAPAEVQPLATEFERLSEDLAEQVGEVAALARAREDEDRGDLTLLSRTTGWDARALTLATHATAAAEPTGLAPEALYGMFRAGLPVDPARLAAVPAKEAGEALDAARKAGVIAMSAGEVKATRRAFESFAREARRNATAPGAASSVAELLEQAPVGAEDRRAFEQAYFDHDGDPDDLWKRARRQGVSAEGVERLQVQGKLAYLTLDNAPLAAALQEEVGRREGGLEQLVEMGLYEPAAWKERVRTVSGGGPALDRAVPPAFEGEKPTDRLDAYADDLARQVRLSFPTRVVADRLEKKGLPLGAAGEESVRQPVAEFLKEAAAQGFELGQTPVEGFLREQGRAALGQVPAEQEGPVLETVKTLHRLFQITPSDHALEVLLAAGFKSADDVRKFSPARFSERFGHLFRPGEDRLVTSKAEQVAAVSYTFYGAVKQLESAPPAFGLAPASAPAEEAKNELIKHFPTLESLFGSLDFCECEHCRSVLSPAAYLVDLLQFVNPDDLVWKGFVADWDAKHPGDLYAPPKHLHPYAALTARRPDIANLPLTCENTNTTLPYIDVVNEILEHYVAEGAPMVHDTGEATSEELLAEPQNTLPAAYQALAAARYPIGLPFDLWTETVRAFFDHFQVPLWKALEMFRAGDDLFPAAGGGGAVAYGRAAVFAEQLGLTPPEQALLTAPDLGARWWELYGLGDEAAAKSELSSAKRLSRRLGVTYKELIALVSGSFVNPDLHALAALRKLGIEAEAVFRYKKHPGYPPFSNAEKNAFEARLDALGDEYPGFKAKKWLDTAYAAGKFDKIVVLAGPADEGDFEKTILRYGDGAAADPILFLKLNVLVRLWRRLGWSLEETDRALHVFVPAASQPLTVIKLGEALRTALVYMAHLATLAERVPVGKNSRLKLLTLWSPLPTSGPNPLYAQLFLTHSALKNDVEFDDPLGEYLTRPGLKVADHMTALQGALGLGTEEIERVLADAGLKPGSAPLTLDLVSLLYRHRQLAAGLKVSVAELISLKSLTGRNPFRSLQASPLGSIDDDHPFGETLAFVDAVEAIQGSGFAVAELDHLLRHRTDPTGDQEADTTAALATARALGPEIQRIRAEHAVPEDAGALADEALGQKLSLLYPPEVVDTFLAMWAGTIAYEATTGVPPAEALKAANLAGVPEIELGYDAATQTQRLTYRGVLLQPTKEKLLAAHPGPVLAKLLDAVQGQARTFFESALADFLAPATFDKLFAPALRTRSGEQKEKAQRANRKVLAEAFLPFLQHELIRRLVAQALATEFDLDPVLADTLVTDTRLLADPTDPSLPLLEAFAAAGERGVTVEYHGSAEASGDPLDRVTHVEADSAGAARPAGTRSVRVSGFLEVPASGTYRLFAVGDHKDSELKLRFAHLPNPVLSGAVATDGVPLEATIELAAGTPYEFSLVGSRLGGGDVRLLVQAERLPKGPLSRLTVLPGAAIARIGRSRALLAKVVMLMERLGLSERELRHVVTHPEDFDQLDLNQLPTVRDGGLVGAAAVAAARALLARLQRLAAYAELKRELALESDALVDVWEHARRVHPTSVTAKEAVAEVTGDLCARIAAITGREAEVVAATAAQLGMKASSTSGGGKRTTAFPDFASERGLRRLWEALVVVERLGVPAAAIAGWTRVVSAPPAQQATIARDLRNATKARYEPEAWQRVAQPIFDGLRKRRRDALVALVMERGGFERIEQLFEYFLVDPGMEPVVQTSRMQLAIASVQLFVQRCLLNLERGVPPRAIVNAQYWDWMKRYRVWEANRKIFLYPENWLEPELRDDKSSLFDAFQASLLQGDVSPELAEDAFFAYLKGLEKIARLDVVSTYVEEKPDPINNVLHVVGRTFDLRPEYFYRRYAHQVWSPWEPIEAEIEGEHVAVVVWRDRLHLFWVTFMEQAVGANPPPPAAIVAANTSSSFPDYSPAKQVQAQLHWTERFQGRWTTRQGGVSGAPVGLPAHASLHPRDLLIFVTKEEGDEERDGALRINLTAPLNQSFRLLSKNSAPTTGPAPVALYNPYAAQQYEVTKYKHTGWLYVFFTNEVQTSSDSSQVPTSDMTVQNIIHFDGEYRVLLPSKPLELSFFEPDAEEAARLLAPFFLSDSANTFYVEPKLNQQKFVETTGWGVGRPYRPTALKERALLDQRMIPIVPQRLVKVRPDEPDPIDPRAKFELTRQSDWLTAAGTVLHFDDTPIGAEGALGAKAMTDLQVLRTTTKGAR